VKNKKCTHCNKIKRIHFFNKAKGGLYGVRGDCILCFKKKSKQRRDRNKDKIKIINKKYRKNNKLELQKYSKEYYKNNRERICNKARDWNKNNKERKKEYSKEYRYKNRNKIRKKKKKYCIANKETIRIKMRKYEKYRKKTDFGFRILHNLRRRVHHALKGKNKSLPTMFLIGCEVDYLLYHLQKKFKTNMSWDNYGFGEEKWVIDHIKPCCRFDLIKESEQVGCFHYSNLQPLWWKENIDKGIK